MTVGLWVSARVSSAIVAGGLGCHATVSVPAPVTIESAPENAGRRPLELAIHPGACALQAVDGEGDRFTQREYHRDEMQRLTKADSNFGEGWVSGPRSDRWTPARAGQPREHRSLGPHVIGGEPRYSRGPGGFALIPSEEFPFVCPGNDLADGWEHWWPLGAPRTYHARGVGLHPLLSCADNRWEKRSVADAAITRYEHAQHTATTLRFGDPGCLTCYFWGGFEHVPFTFSDLPDPWTVETCAPPNALDGSRAHSWTFSEISDSVADCYLGFEEDTYELFQQTPDLEPFTFVGGGARWTEASRAGVVVASVDWREDGLPASVAFPQCDTSIAWTYTKDTHGRVVEERRTTARRVETGMWTMTWSTERPTALRRMIYDGYGGPITIEFDAYGNLTAADLGFYSSFLSWDPSRDEFEIARPGNLGHPGLLTGLLTVDYSCWEDKGPFTTREGWVPLLFELSVNPFKPEHESLFPVPQFVYAALDHNEPIVAAGVWGTGRGPISDLDLTGRFGPYWCDAQ